MSNCPACGHELPENVNFCPHCGVSVSKLSGDTTRVITPQPEKFDVDELSPDETAAIDALPSSSALLLVHKGGQPGARFLIDADVSTAGRHPRSDIFLDDITVSRHHARITREDHRFFVSDQNSLNGTYVNGESISTMVELHRGDEVQIGKFRMVFFAGQD